MAEEQACLVRARSDSDTSAKLGSLRAARSMAYTADRLSTEGAGEPGAVMASSPQDHQDGNDSGELLDYNDASVLEQFHEEAVKQAGCGMSQARVVLASGLAVGGGTLELAAIPFILPSAEIELCILPHEKNWLVMISLVGGSVGAVGWGVLASRLGRRRTLLSCLAVNAVFASIAAFMPTYGTFMMARFCSSLGSGGIVATCYTYCGEAVGRARRACALAALLGAAGGGLLGAAALAGALLPRSGALTLIENKEHFSAWHRYLLLCTLPILASLVSLIWTQESPRYLLDVGREVDAMGVYQSMHSSNQVRVCGARSAGEYRAGELALPTKPAPPARGHAHMFWKSFFQLFSNAYRHTTLSLGGTLLFAMAIQFYLSAYVPATVERMENEAFDASKRVIQNESYADHLYNTSLENVEYTNVTFDNCTFKDILMYHVTFVNCSFLGVHLSNIQSSYTSFRDCVFVNTTIIDTDLEVGRELEAGCVLRGSVVRGMRGACSGAAALSSRPAPALRAPPYAAHAALLAAPAALLPRRLTPDVGLCGVCVLLSPLLYVAQSETALYIVEAVYRFFISLIFFNVGLKVVNTYPANLRCPGHGLMVSAAYSCGAASLGLGAGGPLASAGLCALLALAAALAARHQQRRLLYWLAFISIIYSFISGNTIKVHVQISSSSSSSYHHTESLTG